MDDAEKVARLQHWIKTMEFLPSDSDAGRQRDQFWRAELESQILELQKESVRTQLNALAYLSRAKNSLRGLIP